MISYDNLFHEPVPKFSTLTGNTARDGQSRDDVSEGGHFDKDAL
jgi:hypothetical protein